MFCVQHSTVVKINKIICVDVLCKQSAVVYICYESHPNIHCHLATSHPSLHLQFLFALFISKAGAGGASVIEHIHFPIPVSVFSSLGDTELDSSCLLIGSL